MYQKLKIDFDKKENDAALVAVEALADGLARGSLQRNVGVDEGSGEGAFGSEPPDSIRYRFVSFRFVSFRFVSFRFVSFRFARYRPI